MLPGRPASVVGGQHHGGLAIGQADLLIQLPGQRHRARPDLRGGSATGIRGLAGMAALHRPPALLATTDVQAEANTLYTRLWDVRLILVEDFVLDDRASAVRAFRRQLPFQRLVHRRWNGTMAFPSLAGSFLTPWLLRILFRGSPGVRRRLPFRGPQRFLQRPAQPLDLLLQLFDFVFQAGYLFGVGFLRHVPAYSSAGSKQGQSNKRFHYAKQISQMRESGTGDHGFDSYRYPRWKGRCEMKVQQIRNMIEKAVSDEEHTGRFATTLRDLANSNGTSPSAEQIKGVVEFVRGYIEHVPYFLEQGAAAGRGVGLSAEIEQMIGELEAYWFESNDLIPDRLGLMGLMDDAYASLVLLQGISDYCRASVGRPLFAQNLNPLNQAIRLLIGEPIASQLDQRVGVTIGQAMMQQILTRVAFAAPLPFGGGPDPIYGNASIDEIVNVRLGAMGIV